MAQSIKRQTQFESLSLKSGSVLGSTLTSVLTLQILLGILSSSLSAPPLFMLFNK